MVRIAHLRAKILMYDSYFSTTFAYSLLKMEFCNFYRPWSVPVFTEMETRLTFIEIGFFFFSRKNQGLLQFWKRGIHLILQNIVCHLQKMR